jgi:hypothetical protein
MRCLGFRYEKLKHRVLEVIAHFTSIYGSSCGRTRECLMTCPADSNRRFRNELRHLSAEKP